MKYDEKSINTSLDKYLLHYLAKLLVIFIGVLS